MHSFLLSTLCDGFGVLQQLLLRLARLQFRRESLDLRTDVGYSLFDSRNYCVLFLYEQLVNRLPNGQDKMEKDNSLSAR